MIHQIQQFEKNALALELLGTFTESDVLLIEKLFEEKLDAGYEHVNILIKVKDLSVLKNMDLKGFIKGELWGITHFNKIGRCAVVSHSNLMKSIVTIENKALHFFNNALEEKYFDQEQLEIALLFITPED